MRRFLGIAAILFAGFSLSCDIVDSALDQCGDACSKVDECDASPPEMQLFGESGATEEEALDCAVNCVQEDRVMYGYSDCQLECINDTTCEEIQGC